MSLAGKVAMSAAIGGTAEVLGGGKFANGAVTGAYVMMFNHMGGEEDGVNEIGEQPDYEDTILTGFSVDVNVTIVSIGYSFEIGEIYDPITGQIYTFVSHGSSFGLEASVGLNVITIVPKSGFKITDLVGTGWSMNVSHKVFSFGTSGNSTPGTHGGTIFDTFTVYKFGAGIGVGISNIPISNTSFSNKTYQSFEWWKPKF